MAMLYRFGAQLAVGADGEERVAQWLTGRGYRVSRVDDRDRQRRGVDLLVEPADGGDRVGVEVKTDRRAHATGNLFLETISVDGEGALGWLFRCEADWLVYLVAETGEALWYRPRDLFVAYWSWRQLAEVRSAWVENEGYRSRGLCVPLTIARSVAASIAWVTE